MEQSYYSQLDKQYKHYLQNLVIGKTFEPIVLRGGKNKPSTTVELHKQIALFQKYEKKSDQLGWDIKWQDWSSKKLGNQKWPSQIIVSTEEDLLFLTNNKKHAEIFKELLHNILEWKPSLKEIIHHRPEIIHDYKDDWEKLKKVIDYLLSNDTKGHYIRSIPVPVHTKFLQQKKNIILLLLKSIQPDKFNENETDLEIALGVKRKPFLFQMRFLDKSLAEKHLSGIDFFACPADELKTKNWEVERIILVENETNLYLLPKMPKTLAIFSSGKALHLLKDIELFKITQTYYWGDLDEEGFVMLNDIRSYYQEIESLFMDQKTVEIHLNEKHTQPLIYKQMPLAYLTQEEYKAYLELASTNGRIEQERLFQDFVLNRLLKIN